MSDPVDVGVVAMTLFSPNDSGWSTHFKFALDPARVSLQ